MKDLPLPNERVPSSQKGERARLYASSTTPGGHARGHPADGAGRERANRVDGHGHAAGGAVHAHPSLFQYFKQLFAQVTNPPIDAIRESLVTDTSVYVGADGNLLVEKPENCAVLKIDNPILTAAELMRIRGMKKNHLSVETVSMLCYKNSPIGRAVEQMLLSCDRAVARGRTC